MGRKHVGSLGYQMMKALQGVFKPGTSRHRAKRYRREKELITSIATMECMTTDVFQFADFIRENWPDVIFVTEVKSDLIFAQIDAISIF